MLAGKAAVCTRVGGNSELVIEGSTGHLVPVGDVQALARAVSGLLRDPARARVYGEAARQRALELFLPETMVGHHEALYSELAGR
jgi:glycosyltransferase involved in cell wall biosynthesis